MMAGATDRCLVHHYHRCKMPARAAAPPVVPNSEALQLSQVSVDDKSECVRATCRSYEMLPGQILVASSSQQIDPDMHAAPA